MRLLNLANTLVLFLGIHGAVHGAGKATGPPETQEATGQEESEGVEADRSSLASGTVLIHGFGGWAVGATDGNRYLGGVEPRGYDSRNFALNVTAQPSPELRIVFQAIYSPPIDDPESIEADIDYGFGEWSFNNGLRFRGGIAKTPFGLYTEIFDVGTLRPFFDLPQGVYGPSETLAKSYFGIGFSGLVRGTGAWELAYDIYGGEIEIDSVVAGNPLLFSGGESQAATGRLAQASGEGEGEGGASKTKLVDMIGARLVLNTPIEGLSLGVSAFGGDPEFEGEPAAPIPSHDVIGAYVDYRTERLSVTAEYATREGGLQDFEVDASYLEVAYMLNDHWQVAARYDQAELDPANRERVPRSSLLEHRDLAVGINYWFSPLFVLKVSYHDIEGNLFAIPGRNPKILQKKPLDPETSLVQFGLQFNF